MNQLTVVERQKEYNVKEIEALKPEAVMRYLCPNASQEEALIFVKFCKAEALNPFLKEVHLIKYSKDMPASIVVGVDTFIKRASRNSDYDGYKAGLIVTSKDGSLLYKNGAVYVKDKETIIGAWAEVYHKKREHPTRVEVLLDEYKRDTRIWKEKLATMIVKVPTAQAFKKSFPEDIAANLYEFSEIDVNDISSPNDIVAQDVSETVEKGQEALTQKQVAYQDFSERIPKEPKLLEAWNTAMSKRFYIFASKELGVADKDEAKKQVAEILGVDSVGSMKEVVCDAKMLTDLNIAIFEKTGKVLFK